MKSNMFSAFEITKNFFNKNENTVLKTFESIESTNSFAKEEAFKISTAPHAYLSLIQTHGRGRGTNTWLSTSKPEGQLFVTWSFSLTKSPQNLTAPLVGLTVFDSIKCVWPSLNVGLKPPNDIYINNKKVAGILVETISMGPHTRLIIGMGLNVFTHPHSVIEAGHLAEFTEVTESTFHEFLRALEKNWPSLIEKCTNSKLTKSDREKLLNAVNSCQVLPQPILDITEHCDLITSSASVSWRDL